MSNRKTDLTGAALRRFLGEVPGHDDGPARCGDTSSVLCEACGAALQARLTGQYVPGAPVQVGDRVKVIGLADSTARSADLGRQGRVVELNYTSGVAQSFPSDPFCQVLLEDGETRSFWGEELGLLKAAEYTDAPLQSQIAAAQTPPSRPAVAPARPVTVDPCTLAAATRKTLPSGLHAEVHPLFDGRARILVGHLDRDGYEEHDGW